MVTGELTFHPFLQPLPGLMVLTSGAMAISTGAIDPMELTTLLALIKGDTTSLGATADACPELVEGMASMTLRCTLGITWE
jgi:hypothetical protein